MLTDGGWLPDGTFRHLLAFDSPAVEKLFRAAVPPAVLGVVYRARPGRHDGRGESTARWDVFEFLARIRHVLVRA